MRHYLAKPERLKTGKRMTSAILGTTQSSFGSLCLQPASHPSTNEVRPCLASDIRRDRARLEWCGHRPASLRDSLGIVKNRARTFLVVEWIRICLPIQGTWVWSLVREDPTCCRATKPMCPQLLRPTHPKACAPQQEKPPQWEARTPQLESSPVCHKQRKPTQRNESRRPSTAKNK